ncbi:MAG: WYL domain-containing transcriptional regulator [Deltaproteobacteria bacterium]|nr:WYL domain-containing transcriptional regulator [Deltaproteobacteria bacterium]
MSRNDQVTRQWLPLQKLESARGATLQELAAALPEDFSRHPRTIRRDLEALEAACFPLLTERVAGQTRWRLMDGYHRVPPLVFSPTELMALVFSRDLLKPLDGTQIKASLDSALNKAAAVLPPEGEAYVRQMQGYFSVGLGPHKTYRQHQATIAHLTRAIAQTRTVQMRYYSASRDTTSRRDVDPYRLWYAASALYLIGYCHLRRDVRLFAVDRIRSLTITNHPCQMPLGFDLEAYVQDVLVIMRGKPIEVELLFDRPTTAWVKDRQWHPSQRLTTDKDGRLTMSLRVADTPELLGWILNFRSGVRVIRPESLRDKVREEARKIFRGA